MAAEAGRSPLDRGHRHRARALDVRALRDPGSALHHGPHGLEVGCRRRPHDGLFVGFVAAPCIGPFVLSLLTYVAAKGSAPLGFGLFFTLAMGLGLPYLVLGTVSGSLKALPRSGEWMTAVRRVFGFALVALAVYFLRPLLPARVYEIGLALPLLAGGVWFLFFEKSGAGVRGFALVKGAVAVLLLAAGEERERE